MDNDITTIPRCVACGSLQLAPRHVSSAFWEDDRLVVVEGIPALVCEHCGERFLDDATATGLDLLRGSGFPPERSLYSIEVPVFDFAERPRIGGQ